MVKLPSRAILMNAYGVLRPLFTTISVHRHGAAIWHSGAVAWVSDRYLSTPVWQRKWPRQAAAGSAPTLVTSGNGALPYLVLSKQGSAAGARSSHSVD